MEDGAFGHEKPGTLCTIPHHCCEVEKVSILMSIVRSKGYVSSYALSMLTAPLLFSRRFMKKPNVKEASEDYGKLIPLYSVQVHCIYIYIYAGYPIRVHVHTCHSESHMLGLLQCTNKSCIYMTLYNVHVYTCMLCMLYTHTNLWCQWWG